MIWVMWWNLGDVVHCESRIQHAFGSCDSRSKCALLLQKDKESRPTATEPPPGPFRPVNPAARTYLVQELPAPKKAAKAGVQESTNQVCAESAAGFCC